jgi:hypothetical protein
MPIIVPGYNIIGVQAEILSCQGEFRPAVWFIYDIREQGLFELIQADTINLLDIGRGINTRLSLKI